MVAFAITLASGYLTYRQRLTSYQLTRDFLVIVYSVIVVLMAFDLARVTTGSQAIASAYPLVSLGLGFVEAMLLLSAAIGAYLRPNGSSYGLLLQDIRSHLWHLGMFFLFFWGTVAAEAYLAFYRPFTVVSARVFSGGTVFSVDYSLAFSVVIGLLFLFFLAYPVALLVVGAFRIQNPSMKKAQLGLGMGFAGSSAIYLISSVSLVAYGFDITAVAYVVLSAFFGVVASNFRNAAVLAGFVTPASLPAPVQGNPRAEVPKPTSADGKPVVLKEGTLTLVEVETTARYEEHIDALVKNLAAERRVVFLISPKESRLNAHFSSVPGVKLYTMSESVHYVAPSTTRSDEVNIPLFEPPVLLSVIERTISSATEPIAIIFDSISDMMIFGGFQPCYKFLKEAAEITAWKPAVVLFILFAGAHEEKNVTAIRSVFPSQLKIAPDGIEIVR
ncbi:MAG TPA: hypothetical protein VLU99_04360 [Nitrososphaerales archaeon]|nr:hypothetical protein [Nitrososphaerales archaeon]HUK75003.1 hypothetical protein [Nitrososphaerales archaeon]